MSVCRWSVGVAAGLCVLLAGARAGAQIPLTPGDLLIVADGVLSEVTPAGQIVGTVPIPHPVAAFGDRATDVVVDAFGRVHILNPQQSEPDYISTYIPSTGVWSHHLVADIPPSSFAHLGLLKDSFYTRLQQIDLVDFTPTILGIPGGSVSEVSPGPDGLLYVLTTGFQATVRVVDPVDLTVLGQFGLPTENHGGISVATFGDVYIADWDEHIYRYSDDGQLLGSLDTGTEFMRDIEVGPDGAVYACGRFGDIVVTDVAFSSLQIIEDVVDEPSYLTIVPQPVALPTDVGLGGLSVAPSGLGLSAAETVGLTLVNYGKAVRDVPVTCTVTGPVSSSVTEVVAGRLDRLSSKPYTFAATFDMSLPGDYTITVTAQLAGDTYAGNDTRSASVVHQETVADFPYHEDFEAGTGQFFTGGVGSSWEHGVPAGSFITGAGSGSRAWVTDLDAEHLPGELSYLQSPPLDCSGMAVDPLLRLRVIVECLFSSGAWVEVSLDGGPFTKLGVTADPGSSHWYNNGDIWTFTLGPAGTWFDAYHLVPGGAGRTVVLRMVMGAGPGSVGEGVGIDDIELLEAPFGAGQAPQVGAAVLDVNGSEETLGFPVSAEYPGPYFVTVSRNETFDLHVDGKANQPVFLLGGPLQVGALVAPGVGQLDIASPTVTTNPFFFTNLLGEMDLSVSVPPTLVGVTTAWQAVVANPPQDYAISNAVEVTFAP